MRSRLFRALVAAFALAFAADVVMAQLPSPFAFSFFTPGLTSLFFLPFAIIGC